MTMRVNEVTSISSAGARVRSVISRIIRTVTAKSSGVSAVPTSSLKPGRFCAHTVPAAASNIITISNSDTLRTMLVTFPETNRDSYHCLSDSLKFNGVQELLCIFPLAETLKCATGIYGLIKHKKNDVPCQRIIEKSPFFFR
ncbi:hypothetical protein ES708_30682 [subsurface metagenome]